MLHYGKCSITVNKAKVINVAQNAENQGRSATVGQSVRGSTGAEGSWSTVGSSQENQNQGASSLTSQATSAGIRGLCQDCVCAHTTL